VDEEVGRDEEVGAKVDEEVGAKVDEEVGAKVDEEVGAKVEEEVVEISKHLLEGSLLLFIHLV
jgi:trimethylamine:corrinoid methyltransferase-like protein